MGRAAEVVECGRRIFKLVNCVADTVKWGRLTTLVGRVNEPVIRWHTSGSVSQLFCYFHVMNFTF
jgi:hypothetical protein